MVDVIFFHSKGITGCTVNGQECENERHIVMTVLKEKGFKVTTEWSSEEIENYGYTVTTGSETYKSRDIHQPFYSYEESDILQFEQGMKRIIEWYENLPEWTIPLKF